MFEYSTEKELKNHIIENFNKFFNFKYVDTEKKLNYGRVDIIGEDENNVYIIEIKKDIILPPSIKQIKRYMLEYKSETDKNIVGILTAPKINKKATHILENETSIQYKQIEDVIFNKPYIVKTIYFTEGQFELLDWIMDKCEEENISISEYIIELIINDMYPDGNMPEEVKSSTRFYMDAEMEKLIEECIEEYLEKHIDEHVEKQMKLLQL